MRRLIECVPNFSEGRDPARVRAIVREMSGIPGACVLDWHSDADHNRTAVTVAGEPEAVAEAALRAVGKAAELIDLRVHTGAHPRIGATDVLPFVPVEGVTMSECASLAWATGRAIWERYEIPVYFYEAAALQPERTRLENVRKGQFEGLQAGFAENAERTPDVGARLHPSAGAVAVGARKYLIAFNVLLNTNDVRAARKIAAKVRASNGGLPGVKAMGVELKHAGRAQVSMNLTDFEQTSMRQAFDAVEREAALLGLGLVSSEIVGLVPRGAIDSRDVTALKLERFSPAMILENRLQFALAGQATSGILVSGLDGDSRAAVSGPQGKTEGEGLRREAPVATSLF